MIECLPHREPEDLADVARSLVREPVNARMAYEVAIRVANARAHQMSSRDGWLWAKVLRTYADERADNCFCFDVHGMYCGKYDVRPGWVCLENAEGGDLTFALDSTTARMLREAGAEKE